MQPLIAELLAKLQAEKAKNPNHGMVVILCFGD